jgi:hypothetical protein
LTGDALARLGAWVTAANQAEVLVRPLVRSAFVPDGYKPKILDKDTAEEIAAKFETATANATAAVLLGLGIGVDPLTALQQIIIIKGRPGMYAKFKVALLLAQGYDIWDGEMSDESVTVYGLRPGDDKRREVTITMAQARKAGWTSNEAYAKTPQDMLWARAAGRLCDRIGAHILLGIPTAEDVPDEPLHVDAQVGRVTADIIMAGSEPQPPAKRTRRASSAKRDADITEPETRRTQTDADVAAGDPTWAPPEATAPAAAPATPTQADMRKMFMLMHEQGIDERGPALAYIHETIGRRVESRADLTGPEVERVIAKLESATAGASFDAMRAERDGGA